jgi:hypothetical protein
LAFWLGRGIFLFDRFIPLMVIPAQSINAVAASTAKGQHLIDCWLFD